MAASPGAAKGEVVFTAEEAVAAAAQGRDVILARPFTEADDVAGFHAARGILTSEGGKASHAALVARGMGRPAVVGAGELEIDVRARVIRVGDVGHRRAASGSRSTAAPAWSRATTSRWSSRPQRRASSACWRGPTRSAGSACAPTPTRPPTR